MGSSEISLTINGESYICNEFFTIFSLLDYLGFNKDLVVLDCNGTILPKEFWTQTKVNNKDKIEILTVAGGG